MKIRNVKLKLGKMFSHFTILEVLHDYLRQCDYDIYMIKYLPLFPLHIVNILNYLIIYLYNNKRTNN